MAKFYDADTRHWLFSDFDGWFRDPGDSRAYVLLGDAGVGKSVIAAALAKRTQADGRLGACYFCCHNDSTRNNPRDLIGTIAYQLCKYNKEYRSKVGGQNRVTTILANSALGFHELFTKLLHEPLGKCNTFSQRMLVIIDALDETNYKSREDLLELLKARFPLLPKWLVFFITSRPEDTVQFYLKRYNPCIKICAGSGQDDDYYLQHEADIGRFLEKKVNFSDLPYSVEDVVAKCNGLFLYAYYISQELSDRTSAIKGVNLADHFPGDIESFFLTNFKRVFDKLSEAGLYRKLFGCVIAAPAPLPLSFISFILEKENSNLDVQTVIDAVSQFVVVRTSDNTFLFLHNLIPSLLTSEKKASRKLFIDRGKAREYFKKIILTFLHCALSDQLEGGVSINRDVSNYLLHVGVRFLCCNYDNRDTMTTVFSCLSSFHFLQKKVDTDRLEIFSVVGDYKLCLECQSLADAEKWILEEICTALTKNIYVLVDCPHLLPSCLRCTSETTQRKLAVSGDTLMTCKSFDWIPDVTRSVKPERMKKVRLLYKWKLVPEILFHDGSCFARAFVLWAKLELFQNKDSHSEESRLRKVRCLLEVARGCLKWEKHNLPTRAFRNCFSVLKTEGLNDWLQELDDLLCTEHPMLLNCASCCFYKQEPSLTALIQRIGEMDLWHILLCRYRCFGPLNSDVLALCVNIQSLMKASRELPSAAPVNLLRSVNEIVESFLNGKLIAVRDPRLRKRIHNRPGSLRKDDGNGSENVT